MNPDSIRSGSDVIQERSDYKNWMPKGMVLGTRAGTLVCLVLFIIFGCTGLFSGVAKTVLFVVFLVATVICACVTLWMALMYRTFDYNGRRKMSKQIIEGIAEYVKLPDGGKCLDVGCGSGALTIACAKRNPNASFVGIDHGYGNIKTANHTFKAGVAAFDSEPVFQTNMLTYGGKYYLVGEGHKEFSAGKITDGVFHPYPCGGRNGTEQLRSDGSERAYRGGAALKMGIAAEKKRSRTIF